MTRELNRHVEQWQSCDPEVMAEQMSRAAIFHAIKDGKHDVLILNAWAHELREEVLAEALNIKQSHTVRGAWGGNEHEAEVEYNRLMLLAQIPSA